MKIGTARILYRYNMQHLKKVRLIIIVSMLLSCKGEIPTDSSYGMQHDSEIIGAKNTGTIIPVPLSMDTVETNIADIGKIVSYAETLIGTPYKYASTDPALGFDCSGFITHVFNHFNIKVPRSSVDFTDEGKEIGLPNAKRGDLILFTGTDSAVRVVGHMGIVTENRDSLRFIHSTSGKAYGVVVTALNKYYKTRFMKVIRMFTHP